MKTVFKVGDKVYHINYGWGIINKITDYIIDVKFEVSDVIGFNQDNLFSFTEYTLQGFSQERPVVLPEGGELCLVRDADNQNWYAKYFLKYENCKYYCYGFSEYPKDALHYNQLKRIKILD